jgi:hypothetical protein
MFQNKKYLIWFLLLALILNLPPVLMWFPPTQMIGFFPALFWANIPGYPLTMIGFPFFRWGDFGAYPLGIFGHLIIVLFWVCVAYLPFLFMSKIKHEK